MASEPFIGQIKLFTYVGIPPEWLKCEGQLLSVVQYRDLYAVIGKAYGGDGQTNFALPDLRGRVAIGAGHGAGLSVRNLGVTGGADNVTLTARELPAHSHGVGLSTGSAGKSTPTNTDTMGTIRGPLYQKNATTNLVPMHLQTLGQTGGNANHPNMQPYMSLFYCIAWAGVMPKRQS